jgi:hypothetical protein
LDGDDYWIDESKLQKQADFLDAHPSFSMCTTAFERRVEGEVEKNIIRPGKKNSYSLEEILQKNIVMASSAMFRRKHVNQPPEGYYQFPYQDWPLWVHLARKGPIGYMDDVTTVYRIHDTNMSGNSGDIERWVTYLNSRKIMINYLEPELRPYCYHAMYTYYKRIMYAYRTNNNGKEVREHAAKCLKLIKYYQFDASGERPELLYYRFLYAPKIHQLVYPMLQAGKSGLKPFI